MNVRSSKLGVRRVVENAPMTYLPSSALRWMSSIVSGDHTCETRGRLMRAPRRRRLPPGEAGLPRRLTPLSTAGPPGPYLRTVPFDRPPRAASEERAGYERVTTGVS